MSTFWPIVLALTAVAVSAVVVVGRTRRRLSITVAVVLGALAVLWIAGWIAVQAGWRDVDGFIDCYPSCDGWQLLGVLLLFGAPIVAIATVAAAVVVELRRR